VSRYPVFIGEFTYSESEPAGLKIRKTALMRMPSTAAVAMAGRPLGKPGMVIGIKPPS
jgi:hypothetical protein